MKKTKQIFALALPLMAGITLVSMAFESQGVYQTFNSSSFHKMSASGQAGGFTGAPGENAHAGNACASCHGPSAASGDGFDILEWPDGVDSYAPGETYSLILTMNDASSKNGFQLVALKASDNTQAGSIEVTDAVRTQSQNAIGRQYLSHRAAGNSSSEWAFDWTAPETNAGNVIFYVATNKTNNNGQTSGDLVRLSQHVIAGSGSAVSLTAYEQIQASLSISLNRQDSRIQINFSTDESEPLHVNVMNAQGQSVLAHSLGMSYPGENSKEVRFNQTLSTGIYFVNFFVGNKAYSEKIFID